MKLMFVAAVMAGTVTPALADGLETGLTFTQVQNELGGYSCGGSVCSKVSHGTIVYANGEQHELSPGAWGHCGRQIGYWSTECVPHTLVSASEGRSPIVRRTETTVTKTLGFSEGAFSIATVSVTK